MSILEKAEQLRKIAEKKSKETGKSVCEVWEEAIKELDKLCKESENR